MYLAMTVSIHASAWEATSHGPEQSTASSCHVSIHASAWEATGTTDVSNDSNAYRQFQSTPPHGRRRSQGGGIWCSVNPASAWEATRAFQSTPPHGRRPGLYRSSAVTSVSIHASAWEATIHASGAWEFQSTPPHGRRPVNGHTIAAPVSIHASAWEATMADGHARIGVSIHASAWEATYGRAKACGLIPVSIHASAWEATSFTRRGAGASTHVSIHASAWEATPPRTPPRRRCFNPRLRMGGDHHVIDVRRIRTVGFNPRLRMGGDCGSSSGEALGVKVSIHASAWEATTPIDRPDGRSGVSIHASAWEATGHGRLECVCGSSFNPRLRMGGDDRESR